MSKIEQSLTSAQCTHTKLQSQMAGGSPSKHWRPELSHKALSQNVCCKEADTHKLLLGTITIELTNNHVWSCLAITVLHIV